MHNPWKVTTLALVALGATVGTSTLTTAYLMRPPMPTDAPAPAEASEPPAYRPAVVRVTPAHAATVRAASMSPVSPPAPVVVPPQTARASEPAVPAAAAPVPRAPAATVAATTTRPEDCNTGADRALRIAKPGALGALLGAGLGAVGGGIADGGKAAGKGAIIGGIAGAALGGGYGAYKTKNECGTIVGDAR
ncbi:MAG TPA: hypothetical protein VHZ49_05675 [Methylomirabilota bacterium]|nr:hypothetical protein [Methylomirabilota bacterium]